MNPMGGEYVWCRRIPYSYSWTAGFRASGQAGAILLEEVQRR